MLWVRKRHAPPDSRVSKARCTFFARKQRKPLPETRRPRLDQIVFHLRSARDPSKLPSHRFRPSACREELQVMRALALRVGQKRIVEPRQPPRAEVAVSCGDRGFSEPGGVEERRVEKGRLCLLVGAALRVLLAVAAVVGRFLHAPCCLVERLPLDNKLREPALDSRVRCSSCTQPDLDFVLHAKGPGELLSHNLSDGLVHSAAHDAIQQPPERQSMVLRLRSWRGGWNCLLESAEHGLGVAARVGVLGQLFHTGSVESSLVVQHVLDRDFVLARRILALRRKLRPIP
mmetsp:Transcript_55256/g.130267  ORF Transcript_55256/g.130267 Transcript_55256/m.130267 type:complete len:288 (+) Transcript_55256:345-1208(+)